MRNLILLITTLLAMSSFGNDIRTLTQGSCWFKSEGDSVQVASFNDAQSYSISKYNLESLIDLYDKKGVLISDIESVDSFLHCSGMGAQIVFKVHTETESYCTWAKFDGQDFKFSTVDLATKSQGICDGVVPGRLIIAGTKGSSLSDQLAVISALGFEVNGSERIARDVYSVTINTRGAEIFKLQRELSTRAEFRFVDLVSRQHSVGDSALLEALSFKK